MGSGIVSWYVGVDNGEFSGHYPPEDEKLKFLTGCGYLKQDTRSEGMLLEAQINRAKRSASCQGVLVPSLLGS